MCHRLGRRRTRTVTLHARHDLRPPAKFGVMKPRFIATGRRAGDAPP